MSKRVLLLAGILLFSTACTHSPSRDVAAVPTDTKSAAVDDSPTGLKNSFETAKDNISFDQIQDQIEFTARNPYPPQFVFSGVNEFGILQTGNIGFSAYNYKQFLYPQQCYVSGSNLKTGAAWETRASFLAKITPKLFEKFKSIRKSFGESVDEKQRLDRPALVSVMYQRLNESPITMDSYLEAAPYTTAYQTNTSEIVYEVNKANVYNDLKSPLKITFRKNGNLIVGQIANADGVVGYKWCAPTHYTYCYTRHKSVEDDYTRIINIVSVGATEERARYELNYNLGLVDKDGERCFTGAYDGKTSNSKRCIANRAAGAKIKCSTNLNSLNIKANDAEYKFVDYYTR